MWRSTVGCIVSLALSLLVMALAATAQPAGQVHRIGLLDFGNPLFSREKVEAFQQGLRDLGYVEGQNIAIEYRYAEGQPERLPELAAELVRLGVHVIVTGGPLATRAAKDLTRTIPIVMEIGRAHV